MRQKIRVGYFLNSNLGKSETFIYDLIKGLSEEKDLKLSMISGKKQLRLREFEHLTFHTGFNQIPFKLDSISYKLGQLLGGKGLGYRLRLRKWFISRRLNKMKLSEMDVAYVDYASVGVLIMNYLDRNKIPLIVHVHGYDVTAQLNDKEYRKQFKILITRAERFIVASHYIRKIMILNGCNPDKIILVRLGIQTEKINVEPWRIRLKSPPSIIFLGRLVPKKHPLALIHAFNIVQKEIPQSRLTIIGNGPLYHLVEERIKELNLEKKVNLTGSLTREESFPILRRHWIYAQHSVTASSGDQEGFGISLAEAAAHELPVVSTIHNGIPENVVNNVTGFLVPEFDFESMAEQIIFLIKNPDIAQKMGKAGRSHIETICIPQIRIKKIKEVLINAAHNY